MSDDPVEKVEDAEKPRTASSVNADWLMRGALARLGDIFDQFTGRKWTPSSSIAASELIERIRKLLDSEAREVEGKGKVVPHHIQLKLQWEKFAPDADETIERLERELLVAAADHINDSLYYTLAPLKLEVKTDYFTEGVKLYASFDEFEPGEPERELNVTIPGMNLNELGFTEPTPQPAAGETQLTVAYSINGKEFEKQAAIGPGSRITLGRTGANDVIIDDNSVSKMHASISASPNGGLLLADTGSTNGTFINDERIAYGKAVPLRPDDKLTLGNVTVEINVVEPEPEYEETVDNTAPVSIDGFEFTRGTADEAASPDDQMSSDATDAAPDTDQTSGEGGEDARDQ
jgi:pSer/pThr/pTyr-binding forkhead associated (FHA) protein